MPGSRVVSALFFVSGAAGLVFELVWFHQCGLIFGNSVWAVSVVLAALMGGLALGNALVASAGRRLSRFLRAYAVVEALVALTGVMLTFALPLLGGALMPLMSRAADAPMQINAVRLAAAFLAMLVPATAMGATLPLVVTALCRWQPSFGRNLGRLYGWNTLGAVAGLLAAEVFLLAIAGIRGSAIVAGALDAIVAVVAFWMSGAVDVRVPLPRTDKGTSGVPAGAARLLAIAFVAGGLLLALEVVWFRFLSMFVLTGSLAMSLMLAAVLAGIGLGGLSASQWLARDPSAWRYLPVVASAASAASVVSYASFDVLAPGPWAFEWYRIAWFAVVLTLPTSWLSGVLFTLVGDRLQRRLDVVPQAAGWLTLANTTGAMCGSLLAGFVLLPVLGMERSLLVLASACGLVALACLPEAELRVAGLATRATTVFTAAATLVILLRFPSGLMESTYLVRAAEAYTADGSRIVTAREGREETVLLLEKSWLDRPLYHRIVADGYSMSGTALTSARYMRSFVFWPMLLHPAPLTRVLVVCYGAGVTAGALAEVESVERIDVVETSPEIVAMSDRIYGPDRHPLHDPRVRLHIEDGRFFLQTTNDRYDLITGEPPPPLTRGTVNLYTRDYFQRIHDRLAEGGMTTYWLPVARWGQYDVKPIVRAFCDVFDTCSLWNGTPYDWMLVGTRGAVGSVRQADLLARFRQPGASAALREVGFELPEQIGATFIGDASFLRELTAGAPILTDEFPRRLMPGLSAPSFGRPEDEERATSFILRVIDPDRASDDFARSPLVNRLWPPALRESTRPYFEYQRVINRLLMQGPRPLRDIASIHGLLTETSLHTLPLWMLGSDDRQQRVADSGDDATGQVDYVLGIRGLVARDWAAAAIHFAASARLGLRVPTLTPLRVYALCLAGRIDEAKRAAADSHAGETDSRQFWRWMEETFGVGPLVVD